MSDILTCENCIHFDVCDALAKNDIPKVSPRLCGCYKDRSQYIELPCKVGDTMYVQFRGVARPVKVKAIRLDTKKNNHRICVWGTFHLYEDYSHAYKATFPFDSIGKSLFYTESEAKMKGGAEY